jgi:formamidopyrimidine-DNA glycosylase
MPELPEVETVARGLAGAICNATIERVIKRRKDLRVPFPMQLETRLEARAIVSVSRRAKYILMVLSDQQVIIAHLGMSGKFLVKQGKVNAFDTHDHLALYLSNGVTMIFNDPRRFGVFLLSNTKEVNHHPLLKNLGPEPLSGVFDSAYLYAQLRTKKQPIKTAIMDQKLVVGVGNIYAAEALFQAGIKPTRRASSLTLKQCAVLVEEIRCVLRAAIASGGSTLRDYVRSSGDVGSFQHHFNVYGRKDLPCLHCKTPIKSLIQAGRSTFFCPSCQK